MLAPESVSSSCPLSTKIISVLSDLKEERNERLNEVFRAKRQKYQENLLVVHSPRVAKSIVILEKVDPLPPLTLYVGIQRNIFGQEFAQNGLECLLGEENSSTVIYDKPTKYSDEIDDFMMEQLVTRVGNGKYDRHIFKVICGTLSLAISPKNLRKKFHKLHPLAVIEDPGDFQWEKSVKVMTRHFCRRCFIYGCPLHEPSKIMENPHRVFPNKVPENLPCGEACYSRDSERSAGIWSNSEKSQFRGLRKILLNNFCGIAGLMETKSCVEVFRFSQEDKDTTKEEFKEEKPSEVVKVPSKPRKPGTAIKSSANKRVKHYKPCDCIGSCSSDCSCRGSENYCEKFCSCFATTCSNRFVGCKCTAKCITAQCSCFLALRECDSDFCKCRIKGNCCKNAVIQQGAKKHLLLGQSDVAGWGAFAKADIEKDEFVMEYTGEIITTDEADRRGKIYDTIGHSFLFDISKEFAVDALHKGNKSKFINHSRKPNCDVKVVSVIGDRRIGIYANKKIKAGEELFIDYQYDPAKFRNK